MIVSAGEKLKAKLIPKSIATTRPNEPQPIWKKSIIKLAHQMVVAKWGEKEWKAFDELVWRESGYNVTSVNGISGACGIGQALPCSKMAVYGKAYRTDPKIQLTFMIDYISGRYITPSSALSFHDTHNYY